jgi:hypothetical protein
MLLVAADGGVTRLNWHRPSAPPSNDPRHSAMRSMENTTLI